MYVLKPTQIMVFWKMTPCGLSDRLTLSWKKFFFCAAAQVGPMLPHCLCHTHTHTTGRTLLHESLARHRGRYLHNTQAQETTVHALIGIRTRDPSTQAAADLTP